MSDQPKAIPYISWWMIWLAMQAGIFGMYFVLERTPLQQPVESPFWIAGFIPLIASSVIRWVVIPKISVPQIAFPLFIVGIAMAEGLTFFGVFVFPAQKELFFLLSVVGIYQFIPTFARRFYKTPEDESKFR